MTTKVKTSKARQGDRGWSVARALVIAMSIGAVVLIGLELYGTYGQPDQPATLAPTQNGGSSGETGSAPVNSDN